MVFNILTTYGIAYLISDSVLLSSLRSKIPSGFWADLIYCKVCLSFWISCVITKNFLESFAILGAIAIIEYVIYNNKNK